MNLLPINFLNNKLLKESIIVLTIRAFGVALSFVTLLLMTNYFSNETVGEYNYLNSILIVLGSICLLGMNSSFLQFSGKLEALDNFQEIINIYRKKVLILVISYMALTLCFWLFSQLFSSFLYAIGIYKILQKAFIGLFFYSLSLLNYEVIRGLKKLIPSEIYRNILRFGILLLGVIGLIAFNREEFFLNFFISTFFLTAFITSINVVRLLNKIDTNDHKIQKGIGYKEIISVSIPMTVSALALLLMQSIDIIMLKNYYEFKIVAYYSVAMRLSFLISLILMSINAIISPQISKLFFSKNQNELVKLINKSIKINFIFTFPVLLLLLCFPNYVLSFFGDNYNSSSNVLKIILIGQIINVFSGSVGVYLNMTGRQIIFQRILLVALVINIVLNLVLIPVLGMVGAALSTSISIIVWNIAGTVYVFKKDHILLFINRSIFHNDLE